MTLDPRIAAYYERDGEETRLTSSDGRLEFERTKVLLERLLPPAPARIVDIGGGPGHYAAWLASGGYEVTLVDPLPLHVTRAAARAASLALTAELGDARSLRFARATFDAALLMGPLYHLTARPDRVTALREAMRVVRPGGIVIAAAISRFGPWLDGVRLGFLADPDFEAIARRDLADGQHRNSVAGRYFTTAILHRPDELLREATEAGLADPLLFAVEGPYWQLPDLDDRLDDPDRRAILLRAIEAIESERDLIAASVHFVVVGTVGRAP